MGMFIHVWYMCVGVFVYVWDAHTRVCTRHGGQRTTLVVTHQVPSKILFEMESLLCLELLLQARVDG